MDRDIRKSRKKAINALSAAIGFWGVDPLEAKVYGALYLSPAPLSEDDLVSEFGCCEEEIGRVVHTLERLGAVKEKAGDKPGVRYFEAESDFFEILQTVLRERQEKEMGKAIQEITDQRAYMEWRSEEEDDPELRFIANRLGSLERFIGIIDKAMYGLKALAGVRNMFRFK